MSFAESHEKNDWLQQGVEARALSRENRRTFDMFRTQYGDISPRTAARLLERIKPLAEGECPEPALHVGIHEYQGCIRFARDIDERDPASDHVFLSCREMIRDEIEQIIQNVEYRIVNPGRPSPHDPLGQAGQIFWRITKSGGEQVKMDGGPLAYVKPKKRARYYDHGRLVEGPELV